MNVFSFGFLFQILSLFFMNRQVVLLELKLHHFLWGPYEEQLSYVWWGPII